MERTVGIDLSAEPAGTAIAAVAWSEHAAEVDTLHLGATDEVVLRWLRRQDTAIGVDCPLGWPTKFVDLITAHTDGTLRMDPDLPKGWRREYVLRDTDRFVHAETGLRPLSVSVDRIGHAAIRLAALLAQLGPGRSAARDGSSGIAEVYPAAALKLWDLPFRGYKRTVNAHRLNDLVDALLLEAPWLRLGQFESLCRQSDDAFDAVVCALVARCVDRTQTIPPIDVTVARREGWIHLPTVPLTHLAD